jgi:hypothetical protein
MRLSGDPQSVRQTGGNGGGSDPPREYSRAGGLRRGRGSAGDRPGRAPARCGPSHHFPPDARPERRASPGVGEQDQPVQLQRAAVRGSRLAEGAGAGRGVSASPGIATSSDRWEESRSFAVFAGTACRGWKRG